VILQFEYNKKYYLVNQLCSQINCNPNKNQTFKTYNFMKSKIYILLIAIATTFAVSSCAEEEVKPKTETGNGGGTHVPDPIKG
jgi:hypothetical protein